MDCNRNADDFDTIRQDQNSNPDLSNSRRVSSSEQPKPIDIHGSVSTEELESIELVPQDGWFNNLVHPDWGVVDDILIRRSPPSYQDGVYEPAGQDRPNPFDISTQAHNGSAGQGSRRGRTAMLVYFGQQIVEEILDVQRPGCPREFFNIPVPKDHPLNPDRLDNLEMPLQRSRFNQRTGQSPSNPRQQLNEITPYLDGTLIYGPARAWTDAIREFKHGFLKVKDPSTYNDVKKQFPADNDIRLPFANPPPPADHYLKPVSRYFRLGNPRGFENPFLLSFGVLWFRWHNHIATNLSNSHPDWDDEKLFNEARRLVIAHYQKIVMYDWLPRWLKITNSGGFFDIPKYNRTENENCSGDLCKFNGYDSEIHPGISQEFQTAAMRFGHTLVTPGLWIRGPKTGSNCNWKSVQIRIPGQDPNVHAIRLCNAFWNSQDTAEPMLDDILRGMASTLSEREDHIVVPDLRQHLFGPLEFSRRDLVAINIQRAREHGLADYNTVRKSFGLEERGWDDIADGANQEIKDAVNRLRRLYNNANDSAKNIDLFVGGLLETTDDGPGELFQKIILDQFLRIRHGDRFWFENTASGYFNDSEVEEVRKVTLAEIIRTVTGVSPDDIQDDVFINGGTPCLQPAPLKADGFDRTNGTLNIEQCTPLQHYDYFTGSGAAYILTFVGLGLCVPGTIGVMICMAKMRERKTRAARQRKSPHKPSDDPNVFTAVEWVGPNSDERNVKVKFDRSRKKLHVEDMRKKPLRMLDLRNTTKKIHFRITTDGMQNVISVRMAGEIDLILRFIDTEERAKFKKNLDAFLVDLQIDREVHEFTEKSLYDNAETKEERQVYLDKFFRIICLQAFKKNPGQMDIGGVSAEELNKISKVQLTRTEFADALGLKPNSVFVRNMFIMVDKDRSGFVGFQEFLDMFIVLASGDAEDKARLIFNMYDLKQQGKLSKDEFSRMIKSLLDLSDSSISSRDLRALMDTMYKFAGLKPDSDIDFEAFSKIFASEEYESTLKKATLGIDALGSAGHNSKSSSGQSRRETFAQSYKSLDRRKTQVRVKAKQNILPQTPTAQKLYEFTRYVENYRLQIFWCTLYILVTIGIFLERAFYYSFEREHAGLRRIAGYGVTVTRGAASAMMFTYTSLLVTMSRNTITFLRETFLHRFIPFDSAHAMHKLVAVIALFFTVMHCVGHGINLYHISTQASTDLNCIFREYFRATDVLASFQYWAFATITGLTGIILTLIVIVMYVFAHSYARRNLFNAFWFTHNFYIFLYIFLVMHGTGRLVQPPLFQNYFYGPLAIFIFDKLISLSRNQVEIDVISADLLPSDVTALKFKRPANFEYRSGQWVRIACIKLGRSEYHPFTLTSAPHEDFLSLHIRAVGPWTTNLRKTYDSNKNTNEDWTPPKVLLDGPFGEGHQDWYKFPVAVLVGGGIGVTPFASILKDIVYKSSTPARFPCQKVYFLWVTRTQKQFEWLTDIIRDVEENDKKDLVSVHIFITQFQQKFDLRTTMLYICERHFQKIAGKSLFTGLKAITHFGRPQFQEFLSSLHIEHPNAKQIGVFSCGPPPMTLSVDKACAAVNKQEGFPNYSHHFENF